MKAKKKSAIAARKKIIFSVIIASLLLYACWRAYDYAFISHAPAVEVNGDPVDYTFYKTPINPKPQEIDKSNKVPQDLGNGMVGIPELQIKFKLPEDLKGIVYYPHEFNGHKYIGLSTAILSNSGDFCVASMSPLGILGKTEEGELNEYTGDPHAWIFNREILEKYAAASNENGYAHPPYVKKINTFYIYFDGPQDLCSKDKSMQILQSTQTKLIPNAISTIEKL